MSKTNHAHEVQDVNEVLNSFDGDATAFRRFFEAVTSELACAQALLVSTLPRGGTQIVQPSSCPESMLRSYNRELFTHDQATWQALLRREPLVSAQVGSASELEESRLYREWLQPHGLKHGAFARVASPILNGYPGVLHVYRSAGDPEFTPQESARLGEIANRLGDVLAEMRAARQRTQNVPGVAAWDYNESCRQFIFDSVGRPVQIYDSKASLDDRVSQSIREQAESRIASVNGELVTTDRIELPDTHGEMWGFRVVAFKSYPAIGPGSYVFFCLQPHASEWNLVRPMDVSADPELARLIPTLKFMQSEFHRTPTLDEIAAKAHLSPFHFHRRFTELLGQTPKHFLLSCQIQHAKRLLMERKTPLATIAAECGFAHQSHFTSRFKQATGLTPTRWRRYATDSVKPSEPSKDEAAQVEAPGCAA